MHNNNTSIQRVNSPKCNEYFLHRSDENQKQIIRMVTRKKIKNKKKTIPYPDMLKNNSNNNNQEGGNKKKLNICFFFKT